MIKSVYCGGFIFEIFSGACGADTRYNSQQKITLANDETRFPPTVFGIVLRNFMGVHSANSNRFNFLVRLSSRL